MGAAIHLPPNANRVLQSWDVDFETLSPVNCEAVRFYTADVELAETLVVSTLGNSFSSLIVETTEVLIHILSLPDRL